MPVPFPFDAGDEQAILQTHTFRDSKGFTAQVRYYMIQNDASLVDQLAAINAILTAIKALTWAAYSGSSGFLSEYGVKQYGTAGQDYASCRMKARLSYQDLSGSVHSLNIPAPKVSIFKADRQTVDPTAVATLNGLMASTTVPPADGTPFVASRSGAQFTNYMGGFFVARQTKKNKLFILDANLDAGLPGD